MTTHKCPITNCTTQVAEYHLMCGRHWGMVPAELRSPVYRTWANGEGRGTEEHKEAMEAAIGAVELKVTR